MKTQTVIAVLVAAGLGIATAALSQSVQVSTEASAEVSASVDPSSTLSSVVSEVSSALSSESSELSSMVSSASSEASSAVSSMSSELESSISSSEDVSSSMMSSAEEIVCSDLDATALLGTALDAPALGSIASVTVFVVTDCSGLTVSMDAAALAQFEGSQVVTDALASSGQVGAEIVAYNLDGTSLTLYVRSRG